MLVCQTTILFHCVKLLIAQDCKRLPWSNPLAFLSTNKFNKNASWSKKHSSLLFQSGTVYWSNILAFLAKQEQCFLVKIRTLAYSAKEKILTNINICLAQPLKL